MIGAPSWWAKTIRRWASNPFYRFLLTQATVLVGLILLLGTSGHPGYGLWVTIGGLEILKGLIFLGGAGKGSHPIAGVVGESPRVGHEAPRVSAGSTSDTAGD